MKHQWETTKYKNSARAYLAGEERVCKNCGKKQRLEREYIWGKQANRQWLPLIGRCKVPTLATKPCPGCKHRCKYRGGAYYCAKCKCWWVDILELKARPDGLKGGDDEKARRTPKKHAASNVRSSNSKVRERIR